jgi:F0F1-type ATP synthase assembly protein I
MTEKPTPNPYIRYSGMAFQLLGTIAAGVVLGQWIDGYFGTHTPWWTMGLTLFFTIGALYSLIRSITQMTKDN